MLSWFDKTVGNKREYKRVRSLLQYSAEVMGTPALFPLFFPKQGRRPFGLIFLVGKISVPCACFHLLKTNKQNKLFKIVKLTTDTTTTATRRAFTSSRYTE